MTHGVQKLIGLLGVALLAGTTYAQETEIGYFNEPGKVSLNTFETVKSDTSAFDKVKVRVGGDFSLQYQALEQETASGIALLDLSSGFNLATANLNIDVQLADGVRMNLITYLSSRHHRETWVKGGYIQFDKLPFLHSDAIDKIMEKVTVKIGHMEINYGDAHFRRTDNGRAILNPFVGNLVMDAFATEVGGEIYYQNNGFLGMVGITNGQLDPTVTRHSTDPSIYFKLGYDKQVNTDLRTRITGSYYSTNRTARNTLYAGDRGGSRYYYVLLPEDADTGESNHTTGRFNPGFTSEVQAIMINPFVKYKGLEFFGTAEFSKGKSATETEERAATQLSGELLYRFGGNENFYIGGRYTTVNAELAGYDDEVNVNRLQASVGWFMTKNVLAKLEYVNQEYKDYPTGVIFNGGKFNGVMLEATISF
ncbi:hypothetical protein SAMN05216480_105160 [Pustulibacterium marinum]|uniref:Phosphate-selective porin O and P n=1 Tax=Pustulibacterium marinum TaxID=1224947 RepID=A0A1I7GPX6_9FLAO|nr:hypothetical protein [Pustulibacterium marinum]SFU50497.1 hypothetical protein SAMN05216480_105160 [Pustulibacterium marinum]